MRSGKKSGTPPYVGALLRISLMEVRRRLLSALALNGYDDISAAQLFAFSYPFPDGAKPSELAVRANQSKQTINHMLMVLEERGYVVREESHPGGRRAVYLSDKGKDVVEVCQKEMFRLETEWSGRVGRAQFETFIAVLKDMPNEL